MIGRSQVFLLATRFAKSKSSGVRFATAVATSQIRNGYVRMPVNAATRYLPLDSIDHLMKSNEDKGDDGESKQPDESNRDDAGKDINKDKGEADINKKDDGAEIPKDDIIKDEGNKDKDIIEENDGSSESRLESGSSSDLAGPVGAAGGAGGAGGGNGNGNDDKDNTMQTDPNTGVYPPLLAIPMKDRPPLPGRPFAINITDPEVIRSIYTIIDKREPYFVLFHVKDQNEADTDVIKSKDSVYQLGVHCQIIRHTTPRPGVFNVLGYPLERCKMENLSTPIDKKDSDKIETEKFPTSYLKGLKVSYATVRPVEDEPYDKQSADIRSLVESIKTLLSKMGGKNPLEKLQIKEGTDLVKDPPKFADFVGSTIHGDPKKIQEILEALNIQTRLSKALELLKVEMKASLIKENTIHNLSTKADEYQTKLFIKEFIKELQKRAGISESEDKKTHKFDERLKHLKLTEEALEAYNAEKAKMESQNEHSSELGVSERYLDWLTSIPWGIYSKDSFNIREARKILERDHYGLKDVKERILEFISMGKVSGKVDGKILCLTGPPGTGKTSIARSIAESLNRKYVRIAMGGIQDVHEVKGHRRTYVGSIPGRIIFALKQAKTSNPLLLIDEIDKLDLSRGGGAASAFLEILDPEQNNSFVDNYIDVKVDLSKVLFVCTANYLGNIPAPLRDRMEIINVSGYTNNEKVEIAKRHLIPDASKKAGFEENHVVIPDSTITKLVEKYCRESGLRNVKKLITRIFSKASLKIVEKIEEDLEVSQDSNGNKKSNNSQEQPQPVAASPVQPSVNAVGSEERPGQKPVSESPEPVSATAKATSEQKPETVDASAAGEIPIGEDGQPIDIDENNSGNPEEPQQNEELNDKIEKLDIPEHIKLEITPEVLKDYVGPEVYTRDRVYDVLPPGVATGLSYSSSGNGDALYIESILTQPISTGGGNPNIHVTGSLKDVMKESASIAYSFAKLYMTKQFPENRFFEAADIHVHCPDGAIPKDGPSAGISFTSSLISLAINKSLPSNVAMTGEITVTGRVLPVGGLREKTLGAKRYGCDTIIFPKDIENELEEIPEEVKEGVKFIPVEWYQEVFDAIFPDVSKEECSTIWKDEFSKLDQKKKTRGSSTKAAAAAA